MILQGVFKKIKCILQIAKINKISKIALKFNKLKFKIKIQNTEIFS